jgi:hypothetical protein
MCIHIPGILFSWSCFPHGITWERPVMSAPRPAALLSTGRDLPQRTGPRRVMTETILPKNGTVCRLLVHNQ